MAERKTCGGCFYRNAETGECHVDPPRLVGLGEEDDPTAVPRQVEVVPVQARPRVEPDDIACMNFSEDGP